MKEGKIVGKKGRNRRERKNSEAGNQEGEKNREGEKNIEGEKEGERKRVKQGGRKEGVMKVE